MTNDQEKLGIPEPQGSGVVVQLQMSDDGAFGFGGTRMTKDGQVSNMSPDECLMIMARVIDRYHAAKHNETKPPEPQIMLARGPMMRG